MTAPQPSDADLLVAVAGGERHALEVLYRRHAPCSPSGCSAAAAKPPFEVAHLRWSAALLAAVSVLLVGLSDPATARPRLPR